jgi:hypothetical protein
MVFPLEHPARIWCQPSQNQGKDKNWVCHPAKQYQVENTKAKIFNQGQ